MTYKYKSIWYIELIFLVPSIFVGIFAMRYHGVPSSAYLQNLVIFLLCWVISCFVIYKKIKPLNTGLIWIIALFIIMYALTFIDSGVGGVHRWVLLGPIRLYVSSIFSPMLLVILWKLLEEKRNLIAVIGTILVSMILIFQPDASQITALGIPLMVMIYSRMNTRYLSIATITGLAAMIIMSWIYLDELPPVEYVEGIFSIVVSMGTIWMIMGVVSLLILPLPFLILPKPGYHLLSRCIGLYFLLILIAPVFGNFPVPVMGYGVSPIIGYVTGITWLLKPSARV